MDLLKICVVLVGFSTLALSEEPNVCQGTSDGLNHRGTPRHRYDDYKSRYTNCTYLDGNLEIVFLEGDFDMSFLKDIQEVTGYVLLVSNYVSYIPLTSLRVIRGRTLFEHEEKYYSLFVVLNFLKPDGGGNAIPGSPSLAPPTGMPTMGLRELSLTSLYEIMSGSVFLFNNNLMCFENTINWGDILTGENAKVIHHNDSPHGRADCPPCSENCTQMVNGQLQTHCWGPGPEKCQKLTRVVCSLQCDGGCFGATPQECCHPECAGGCTGPLKTQCWACKNFRNDLECVEMCPPLEIYDKVKFQTVPNPDAKYAYGTLCVSKCPSHLLADRGACVRDCGAGRMQGTGELEGSCVECEGPCPKTCDGTTVLQSGSDFVHANNIANFTGCTIIKGGLKILSATIEGDNHNNIPQLHPSNLSVFETVREITGYLQVEGKHPDFKSLSYFKNLETISGRVLSSSNAALHIYDTTLESLEVRSLKHVKNGGILVAKNGRLCYASTVNWGNIRVDPQQRISVSLNKNVTVCAAENKVCDAECSSDGCWGPGNNQCLSCQSYSFGKQCLSSCNQLPDVYEAENKVCMRCHDQCKGGCTGPGADSCEECKNVKDGPFCVPACPTSKYSDINQICQSCHDNCKNGCTGPHNTVGENACNDCYLRVMDSQEGLGISKCLPENMRCEEGYHKDYQKFNDTVTHQSQQRAICRPCHHLCKQCDGPGIYCEACTFYKEGNRCVENCSANYFADNTHSQCQTCDNRCSTCRGPSEADCLTCKSYKVYWDVYKLEEDPRFNCTNKCPKWAEIKVVMESPRLPDEKDTVCVPAPYAKEITQRKKKKVPTATLR